MINFKSKYKIGQKVKLNTKEFSTESAYIRAVMFSTGKVRYSIFLPKSETTLHNIDSCFVTDSRTKNNIEFNFDNYS